MKKNMNLPFVEGILYFFHLWENPISLHLKKMKKENDFDRISRDWQNIVHTSQLLTMFQVRGINNQKGNKGTIESLSDKPLNIVFESEEIKKEMLHSDLNPLKTAYIVDVVIQNANTKPFAYKILKLHETLPLE